MKASPWLLLFFSTTLIAQAVDLQNRTAVKMSLDITDHVYIPVWSITNLRSQSPNNTNLFAGIGYRGESWWMEGMAQKQWSASGGLWSADLRFRKQWGRFSLYVEPSVILPPKPAIYGFVVAEERVWKGVNLRLETESTNGLNGQNKFSAGGGLGLNLGKHKGWDLGGAIVGRASPTGLPDRRAYVSAAKRFSFRKGSAP